MPRTTQPLSFRLPAEKADRLQRLAEATDRPRSWHIEQALDAYLGQQAWQIEHMLEGLGDLEAGRSVAHEEVRDWLLTWGRGDERDPPA